MFLDCQQQSVMSTKKANLWRTLIWRPFHLHLTHNVSLIMCFSLLNCPILAITIYGIENQIQQTKTGCKESHFYTLPFGQAEANI